MLVGVGQLGQGGLSNDMQMTMDRIAQLAFQESGPAIRASDTQDSDRHHEQPNHAGLRAGHHRDAGHGPRLAAGRMRCKIKRKPPSS